MSNDTDAILHYTYLRCTHKDEGECCFRQPNGRCVLLTDMEFDDKKCHFRKGRVNGPILYDLGIKAEPKELGVVYCKSCALRRIDGVCMRFSVEDGIYRPADGDYCSRGV